MKKLILAISCSLFLAACGQTIPNKKEINMLENGERINAEETKPALVKVNEFNQLGNDSFSKTKHIPEKYILDVVGDYTYFMYQSLDMYGKVDGPGHLSIMKGNKWIIKDKELPIDKYHSSEYLMLGSSLVTYEKNTKKYLLLSFDEKGEVSEELPLNIPESKDTTDSETMTLLPTTKGNTVYFSDVGLFLDPEDKKTLVKNEHYANYIDFDKNIGYKINVDGITSAFDMKTQEPIYNDVDGQVVTWNLPRETRNIIGQKENNTYYTWTLSGEKGSGIHLYDQNFNECYFLPVELKGESGHAVATMIAGKIYFYEALMFKGKPSIRVTVLN